MDTKIVSVHFMAHVWVSAKTIMVGGLVFNVHRELKSLVQLVNVPTKPFCM